MKIVKDERLMIEGLKHIRLVFILQKYFHTRYCFFIATFLQDAGYESVSIY